VIVVGPPLMLPKYVTPISLTRTTVPKYFHLEKEKFCLNNEEHVSLQMANAYIHYDKWFHFGLKFFTNIK